MSKKKRSFVLTESFNRSERRDVDPALLEHVRELHEAGRCLDAFGVATSAGPLQAWRGAAALELGSRLAMNLGGERVAVLLAIRAHREHPLDARVSLHYGEVLAHLRGPMAAWAHALRCETGEGLSDHTRAEFLALRATIAAGYRDFDTAEDLLLRALALEPSSAWLQVQRASILLAQELREEALLAVDEALRRRPWFRPAVQYRARLLHILNRWGEAVDLLVRSLDRIQSAPVVVQLIGLKREADDDAGMLELLERVEALSPLASAYHREWLAAWRADALCLSGELSKAAIQAELARDPYYDDLAKRLRAPVPARRRVRLRFQFIPQGHRTCGPATLAAIAQYWEKPATQQSIVEAISYGGTHDYSERIWCEQNGFAAREFRVTWEAVRLLVDEGMPFALTTAEVDSGHLQAVIGYDLLRETLFIQDPGEPHYREVPARKFLERYRLTGPRGMVLVPDEQRSRIDGLELPDSDLFDGYHAFHVAIAHHRREDAVEALGKLERRDPSSSLAMVARLMLAGFDGDTPQIARVLDQLMALFPEDQRLLAWRLSTLREMGRSEDRFALLHRAVRLEEAHPVFTKELALERAADMRHRTGVRRLLWKAHRMLPHDPTVLVAIADWDLRTRRNPDLLHFYRFASGLSERDERFALGWFDAMSAFGRSEEGLSWLRRRFDAFGGKSGAPAITLCQCLHRLNRTEEALAVLAAAIERRPKDGELLLFASRLEARCDRLEQAQLHLDQSREHCAPRSWRRAAAALHSRRGERREALRVWREVIEQEPLAMDAHQAIAEHLASLEGEEAALHHVEEACARFPHHHGLGGLHLALLRKHGPPDVSEAVARRLMEVHPNDPWSRRELALILAETHRPAEALELAQSAIDIAPDQAQSHTVRGFVLAALGRDAEAAESHRQALRRDVNYPFALGALMELMPSTEARREALTFVRDQMDEQPLQGQALQVYRRLAYPVLSQQELASQLRAIRQSRPDLWEAWSILAAQERDSGNTEEAERLASVAVARFPLVSGAWRDLAVQQRLLGNSEAAVRAIRRAVELNPDWPTAWLEQARLLEESEQRVEAIASLREGIRRLPRAASLRLRLAEMLWRADERDEAWGLAARAAEDEPGLEPAWWALRRWALSLQREGELVALARRIVAERPGEARSWMILASVLPPTAIDEELQAYDAAIARSPRLTEAYDLKASALARQGRLDAAEQVLRQGPWGEELPAPIRGRLAWLRAGRGEIREALAEMTRILEQNRDYNWGWERAAEWAQATGDVAGWQRAARELIRLAPKNATAYCHAAAAELERKNPTEAAALLSRALQVEPGHAYAARTLLRIHWDKRDASALEGLPSLLLQGGPTFWVSRAAEALAAALKGDALRLRTTLAQVICSPDENTLVAQFLASTLLENLPKFRTVFLEVLDECATSDRIGPSFAAVWVRQQAQQNHWESWKKFGAWIQRMGEHANEAMGEFLDRIGEAAKAALAVPELIEAHGPWLRSHTLLWGKVGYALAASGLYEEGARWLQGGESRPDAQGWMLVNLVACLRHLRRHAEASAVSTMVVQRGLRDDTWSWHVSQAAIGAAFRADFVTASALLRLARPSDLQGDGRVTHALAGALCRVLPAPAKEARKLFAEERRSLRGLASQIANPSAALVAEYDIAIDRMVRHTGVWRPPWAWSYPERRPGFLKAYWFLFALAAALTMLARACTT